MRPLLAWVGLVLLAAVLFSAGIGGYDLWPADEPRFAEVAREMLDTGDYLAPHVNGEPYKEKPPLLFWAIAGVAHLTGGEVNEVTARIPSVVSAVLIVAITFGLAYRMFGFAAAVWASVVLITSFRFWWQARTVQIDMLLTACTTLTFMFFWLWHERRSWLVLILFYLSIAAGVYAKGPPALVFPLLMIFTLFFRARDERKALHWVVGTLAVFALVAVWLIPARMAVAAPGGADTDIMTNLYRQTIGRFFLGVNHPQPFWYFGVTLLEDWMPWTFVLPWSVYYTYKHRKEGPQYWIPIAWILPAIIFFSLSSGKRAIYLLPIFPPMAILIGQSIAALQKSDDVNYRQGVAIAWGVLCLVLAAAPFAVFYTEYSDLYGPFTAIVFSVLLLAMAVPPFLLVRSGHPRRALISIAAFSAVLFTTIGVGAFPIANPVKSTRAYCAPMRALNGQGVDYALYSIGFSRESYIFYSEKFHTPVLTDYLPVDGVEGVSEEEEQEAQAILRGGMVKATRKIDVESFAEMDAETLAHLESAIEQVYERSGIRRELIDAFLRALEVELAPFQAALDDGQPVLVMVQHEDLRWLWVVYPPFRDYAVLKERQVGSRDMALLASPAAAELLEGAE